MPDGPQISDYFEIEIVPLPNYMSEESRNSFIAKVEQLRTRFQVGTKDSLFVPPAKIDVRLSIDQLARLVGDYWRTIKDQPELNLPPIHSLYANYECERHKREVSEEFKANMTILSKQIGLSTYLTNEHQERLKESLSRAQTAYCDRARDLEKVVFQEFKQLLLQDIQQQYFY